MIKKLKEKTGVVESTTVKKTFLRIILSNFYSPRPWTVPVILLVVAGVSYGLYAKHMSFYWDDWSFAWVRQSLGLQGLKSMADISRPMRAYFEAALSPLLGINPLAWQIYAVILRWIASVALWWSLRQIWTKDTRLQFVAALFYLVYPGFGQQFIAMTYHYFWFFQIIFFLSLGLMVWAVRALRRGWLGMLGALVFSALQLFSSEYLVGLELVRPIILWVVLAHKFPDHKRRLGRTIIYSIPFLLILGVYLYWRVFLLKFPTYQPTLLGEARSAPLHTLLGLIHFIWYSLGVVTVQAWENTLQVVINQWSTTRFALIYPLLVVFSTIGLILYQNRLQSQVSSEQNASDSLRIVVRQSIGIGLWAILIAGLPFYVTGLTVSAHFDSDRFTMSYLFGASLLLAGLLGLLPHYWQSITLASSLASLAIGMQFYNSAVFRKESDLQKLFAWQLAWRIPELKSNTILLADDHTFPFTDDEGLTYLVNWIYAPENRTRHLPVALSTLSSRLGTDIPSLQPGQPIYQNYFLGSDFLGSTDQAIVIYFNPPACLRILNPAYDQDLIFLQVYRIENGIITVLDAYAVPPLVANALPLSNMNQIIPSPDRSAVPPAGLFNAELSHTWCYYFEKADLARQTGDWQAVAQLGDEAFGKQLFPRELSENLVFIEGYARLGRWQDADRLTRAVSKPAPILNPALCSLWNRVKQAGPLAENGEPHVESILRELQCNPSP